MTGIAVEHCAKIDLPRTPALVGDVYRHTGVLVDAADIAVDVYIDAVVEIGNQHGRHGFVLFAFARGHYRETKIHPDAIVRAPLAGLRIDPARRTHKVLDVAAAV